MGQKRFPPVGVWAARVGTSQKGGSFWRVDSGSNKNIRKIKEQRGGRKTNRIEGLRRDHLWKGGKEIKVCRYWKFRESSGV